MKQTYSDFVSTVLLSTSYLPPIRYFSSLLRAENVILEKYEHYLKQTYRNRTVIFTANGLQNLIIPVRHEKLYSIPIQDVKISYATSWQEIHWRTITSAYRNSPYFEYFEDELRSCFDMKVENLFDFNLMLLNKILTWLKITPQLQFTSSYSDPADANISDLRNAFNPWERERTAPYRQVFSDRHGFQPDLSIADLLFNQGLNAKNYLLAE